MSKEEKEINIKVLMYHRVVEEDRCRSRYSVTSKNFRQQLRMLQLLNITPVTFEDYHLYLKGKLTLPKNPIILTFDDGHLDTFTNAYPILQEFDMKAVIFVMGNRELQYADWDGEEIEKTPLMKDEHILEMREAGFEIGAHSMTHAPLSTLKSEELKWEISVSKKNIENLLQENIYSFAYPYGRVNRQVQSLVLQEGFRFGCGVYTGSPRFGASIFDIRRLSVLSGTGLMQYFLKVLTPYQYAEWIYGKLVHNQEILQPEDLPEEKKSVVEYDMGSTIK
ncbi:MAG: polysaccharide deacetylase family protein [Balneolaceae bacterium]